MVGWWPREAGDLGSIPGLGEVDNFFSKSFTINNIDGASGYIRIIKILPILKSKAGTYINYIFTIHQFFHSYEERLWISILPFLFEHWACVT